MKDSVFLSKCASIYLNRSCPRRCPACAVVKPMMDRDRLSADRWIEAFEILRSRGIEFFLILATEPLLIPEEELLQLIRYWRDSDVEYGLYTTSPKYLFDKLKDKMLEAGVRNWSSGIDYVPKVYDRLKSLGLLSDTCMDLIDNTPGGGELRQKGIEALAGMSYMFDHGIDQQHLLITIYRSNIEFIPEMVRWIVDEFDRPTVRIALNYVEHGSDDFDFAMPADGCSSFLLHEHDRGIWERFIAKMDLLEERYWLRVQTPRSYLLDFDTVLNQDSPGMPHYCAVGVENDGSMRKCGYRVGSDLISECSVFDLANDDKFLMFLRDWEFEVTRCSGCAWAYKPTIDEQLYLTMLSSNRSESLVDYRSEGWEDRMARFSSLSNHLKG